MSALLETYSVTGDPALESQLVEQYMGLARVLAERAARDPSERDDAFQVAQLGLLHALKRFDPSRGVEFTTFAWSTIQGELKRFHRGHSWRLHVPRRLQEAYLRVAGAAEDLTQELGRAPTIDELAARTGDAPEVVVEALDVRSAVRPLSLDMPAGGEDTDGDLGWQLGGEDANFGHVEDSRFLGSLVARLPKREQEVLRLRFVHEMTQAEIAARIGISQMHVSRLLTSTLAKLREWAAAER